MIWLSRILLVGALGVSFLLLLQSLGTSGLAGCDGGSACDTVLTSRWSHIGPVPVSAFALLFYGGLVGLSFPSDSTRRKPRQQFLLVFLAVSVFCGVAWFIALQAFVIGAFCIYCMISHSLGAAGALLLWIALPAAAPDGRPRLFSPAVLAAAAAFALFAMLQIALPQRPSNKVFVLDDSLSNVEPAEAEPQKPARDPTPPPPGPETGRTVAESGPSTTETGATPPSEPPAVEEPKDTTDGEAGETPIVGSPQAPEEAPVESTPAREPVVLSLHEGRFHVSTATDPYLGDPLAEALFVSMFDYTCTHCKTTHEVIQEALEEDPGRFAVITLVAPLNRHCNPAMHRPPPPGRPLACEYARLALAVYQIDPESFQTFDDWLFSDASPVFKNLESGPDAARRFAAELVGASALSAALDDPRVDAALEKSTSIYRENNLLTGKRGLPQQIIGEVINVGPIRTQFDLQLLLDLYLE